MLSLFPLDVLDEIWDLIESVSEFFYLLFSMLISIRNTKIYNAPRGKLNDGLVNLGYNCNVKRALNLLNLSFI